MALGVQQIHHTAITVASLEASVAFYRDRLGFVEVIRRHICGGYLGRLMGIADLEADLAILRAGPTKLELIQYRRPLRRSGSPSGGNPGSVHLSLLVADVREMDARLRAEGVVFQSDPVAIDDGPNRGGWAVFLFDPDGYWVELLELTPLRRQQIGLDPPAAKT